MPSFRYTLEPYKGRSSRYTCPQCNHKRRTFVRYIDTHTGLHLAPDVGRCGRQDSCGYHKTPKQFFENHELPNTIPPSKGARGMFKSNHKTTPTFPSFIPSADWQRSLCHYGQNNFVQYLGRLFGWRITDALVQRYHIGTSKKWPGASIFWMVDETGSCRTGKIMLYDSHTGKRVKEPYNHISWVHTLKDKIGRPLYPGYQLKQSLYGAHLLADTGKPIGLVESEKTAIIASHFYPDKIWLASGGKEGLTKEKCAPIRHRDIYVYPDAGSYDAWKTIAQKLLPNANISDLLEQEAQGMDMADLLVRMRG